LIEKTKNNLEKNFNGIEKNEKERIIRIKIIERK